MIRFLAPHGHKLYVRKRRRISTHVTEKSCDCERNREFLTLCRIDAGIAGIETKGSGDTAGNDFRLAVNNRDKLWIRRIRIDLWILHARLRKLIRSADT